MALRFRREPEHVALEQVVIEIPRVRVLHRDKPRRGHTDGDDQREHAARDRDEAQAAFDKQHRRVRQAHDRDA